MKYSQFNSIIPYSDKYALYNTFKNKVIFLEPELKDILLQNVQNGINNLENIHPDFFHYLSENHFIVEDNINELEEIKKLVYEIDEGRKIYDLTINPTINCNFKCWYCYETHVKQSKMDVDIIERINKLIPKLVSDKELEIFTLSFFGGEPLLYFEKSVVPIIDKFIPVVQQLDKKFNIGFTTNAYLINDKFIEYFVKKEVKPFFQITLDGYRENHDKVRYVNPTKGSYDVIVKNIKKLINNELFVILRINYTEKNIEDTYKISDDFSDIDSAILKKYLLIDFHRVWQNVKIDNVDNIVDVNVEKIRGKGLNVKSSGYNPETVFGSCYADKRNSAVINYNGDVYKCTARDFKTENREGYLNEDGEIVWENNSLEQRMNSKFQNKPCLSCRLLSCCNGCCSQQALEHLGKGDYCIYSSNEAEKDKVIKQKVDLILQENEAIQT